ncbi:FG-GAP repeat-containing protein, partial [Candidatus Magnetobacterium bavaricum]
MPPLPLLYSLLSLPLYLFFHSDGIPDNWQLKAIADFDGDGKADMLWQNTTTGDVYVWLMDGAGIIGGGFVVRGMPALWQLLTVADYNGDGKAKSP